MQGSAEEALDEVIEQCSKQPLQKATYWLMQKACILSSLSLRVYDSRQIEVVLQTTDVKLTRLPKAVASTPTISVDDSLAAVPEAKLLSGPQEGMPVHAVWAVKDLGVVVAFRGTSTMQDVFADVSFQPVQLASTNISVHGAVYTAAARTISAIRAAYSQAAQQCRDCTMPLYFTG